MCSKLLKPHNLVFGLGLLLILAVSPLSLRAELTIVDGREEEAVSAGAIRELARVHYVRARTFYRRGEYAQAKAEFQEVLKLDPQHQGAKWYLQYLDKELANLTTTLRSRPKELKQSNLALTQQRSTEANLRAEQKERARLEKEEAKLRKQLKKYQAATAKAQKSKQASSQQLSRLQDEKKRLQKQVKKYQQAVAKQEGQIEQLKRKPGQVESARLQQTEQDQLLQSKFEKYQQSLERAAEKYESKVQKLEQTSRQLARVEQEKDELQAQLSRLQREQDDELFKYQLRAQEEVIQAEDQLQQDLAQVDENEDQLLRLQQQINAQLKAQLNALKKEKAQPVYDQALKLFNKKKYKQAKQKLEKALTIYPDFKAAKDLFSRIRTAETIEVLLAEGQHYYKEKDYLKAQTALNKALSLDFQHQQARDYLHKVEKAIKDQEQAELLAAQREQERREKEKARLTERQRQAEAKAMAAARKKLEQEQARIRKEEQRKLREKELARLKLEKEKLRLAKLKIKEEQRKLALLRKEEQRKRQEKERQAREEELARRQAEKEKQRLAKLKIKEEQRKAREQEIARRKAEQEKQRLAKLRAKEEERARREKERLVELKAKEQARKEREKELAKIRIEKERLRFLEEKAKEKQRAELRKQKEKQRLARLKAKEEQRQRKEKEPQARQQELTRRQAEQEKERLAKLKAKEEQRAAKEKERLARLKAEEEQRKQARLKKYLEKVEREKQRLEEEKLRLARKQRQAEAKAMARAKKKLEQEQARQAREEELARRKAEQERLRQEERQRQAEAEARALAQKKIEQQQARQERKEKIARLKAKKEQQKKELRKKIDLHYSQGKKHFNNKDYIAARKEFKDILYLDPDNQYALNALEKVAATIEKQEKDYARRKQEREEAAKKQEELKRKQHREEINQHLAQGKVHFYKEEYLQAINEFGKVLILDPDSAKAEQYIRKCQKAIEEQEERKVQAKEEEAARLQQTVKVIQEEEEKEKVEKIKQLYRKGKTYFRRGLYSEAIACFKEVIELEGNPRIHYTPQAQELIERAQEKQMQDAQKIAEEEVKRRQEEKQQKVRAEERAEQEALQRKEESIREHYNLGKKYYSQGNYPMAIAEMNKIAEIDPQHAYVAYAQKYITKSQQKIIRREEQELKAELKQEFKAQKEEEEISSKSLYEQARWYYRKRDYERTIKICRAALELNPLDKRVRNLLYTAEHKNAKVVDKYGRIEKAITEKDMMAEVEEAQGVPIIPEIDTTLVPQKEFIPIVKIPPIREKLRSPITVDFRDVDLSFVLNFLSDSTGVNIIPASGVSLEGKKVTMKMKDISAEQALKYILKNQGLNYRIEEDAIWVASPSEMDKEQVETRVYFLNRGSGMFTEFERMVGTGTGLGGAASISKITTLKDVLEEAVNWPKDSKLVLDERSGALIISNIPSNLQIIEDILYNLDIRPIQVLIEARFVELQVTDTEELGIEWATTAALGDKRRDGNNVTQWESGAGWDFSTFSNVSEGLNLTYTGVLTYPQFQTTLHAFSKSAHAKTLSAPRVTTLNNQMASIKVVDEWIYPTRYEFQVVQSDVNGDGDFDDANETTYSNVPVDFITKDIGILLHVTPNVGADEQTITLALVPEVSEGTAGAFTYTGSVSLPKFSSRTLSTSVVINNGDTVVLGGLVKESTTKTTTKVPILGDIPFLGAIFRKQSDSIVRKNLLIFVTATIITPSGEKVAVIP